MKNTENIQLESIGIECGMNLRDKSTTQVLSIDLITPCSSFQELFQSVRIDLWNQAGPCIWDFRVAGETGPSPLPETGFLGRLGTFSSSPYSSPILTNRTVKRHKQDARMVTCHKQAVIGEQ